MRIFTFGCSITKYFYPTWADILIEHYGDRADLAENWGKSGAGNQYIFTRLWEADAVHQFCEDDIIVVQWTSMFREDRYHEGSGWHCPGGFASTITGQEPFVLHSHKYENEWEWADELHCVMRDCALISSTRKALEAIGCKFIFTGFREFAEDFPGCPPIAGPLLARENIGSILTQYIHDIKLDVEPVCNFLGFGTDNDFFKQRPMTVPMEGNTSHFLPEIHPLPKEHLKFVEELLLPALGETCNARAKSFAEHYENEIRQKDPIVLLECDWYQISAKLLGFSDDRWRP